MLVKIMDWLILDRYTLELARLNEIWAGFNEKETSVDETLTLVLKEKWKYHIDKVKLLILFLTEAQNIIKSK